MKLAPALFSLLNILPRTSHAAAPILVGAGMRVKPKPKPS